ncbi:lipid IV(A) 3-deoxy-D-manno-octulosonic acid transferase [Catenovulum sp. 2E275]|uniref:lipid IV(A) 3-deoxy-D-manno-octulosonic acid transferase n=1 Tax=Catenovulum sp. 2E275 TaxID=2980497 RepID=UPI0021D2A933|nr:lipid IV(A) 3-deoxy-D-manno-octulosonic acid transferase [Catenovulum sp. 2E275]MCU4674239.1 lipid IV(A) 3-deoxy-D-manno-octulosonic acid transferase [Catenovulum sp. 2E275]
MTHFIYNQLMRVLLPFMLLRLKRKSRKQAEYGFRWDERLAKKTLNIKSGGALFHLASLGETIAATPVIKAFMQKYPTTPVTITSTTPTGSEQIKKTFGDTVTHCYMPFDLPIIQRRFINQIKPAILVLMETELWPNLIHHTKRQGGRIVVMNARLSERSAKGYQKLAKLTQAMMRNIHLICAQFEQDAKRFEHLGCNPKKLKVTGNIKFDTQANPKLKQAALELAKNWQLTNRPVWLAASTHCGEEEQILAAHKQVLLFHPDALLILVPRHPERFEPVYQLSSNTFKTQKRSELTANSPLSTHTQVILGNSLGEMDMYIGLANFVFVGGSLVERGGHNPFEAACQQKAIITGQHLFNFADSYQILREQQAVQQVNNEHELAIQVKHLIEDSDYKNRLALNAYNCQKQFQGAQQLSLQLISQQFKLAQREKRSLKILQPAFRN